MADAAGGPPVASPRLSRGSLRWLIGGYISPEEQARRQAQDQQMTADEH